MDFTGIRLLREEELDESVRLSSFAFQYDMSPSELADVRKRQRPEHTWGYFENGRLCAKTVVHPMRIWLGGRSVPMGGVASVATWPEYRRQGLVRQLLLHVLKVMKDERVTVSFLFPFSVAFYRKFGWEMAVDVLRYELDIARLRGFTMHGTMRRLIRPLDELAELQGVYAEYARKYNGMMDRQPDWWEQRVLKSGLQCYVYEDEDGLPQGYLLYELKNRLLTVQEFVYLHREARDGMLAFIANHDSMADTVKLRAPADDRLPFHLTDPRFKQERLPFFMGRIVDARAFVADFDFRPAERETRIALRLEDEAAPWNDGVFVWTIDREGRGTLEPAAEPSHPGIACGIQTLSAMLIGYLRPAELYEDARLTGDEAAVAALEARLPAARTFLTDSF